MARSIIAIRPAPDRPFRRESRSAHHLHVAQSSKGCRRPGARSGLTRVYVHQAQSFAGPATGRPAMETRLMQYRLPLRSGRLCPRWVPVALTVSPSPSTRLERSNGGDHTPVLRCSWLRSRAHPIGAPPPASPHPRDAGASLSQPREQP